MTTKPMTRKPPREPFVWALFSAGGMASALLLPVLVVLLWVALPLGWLGPVEHEGWAALAGHPLVRAALALLAPLFFFHWAHRFRYTLYDGLQLYHLNQFIALVTYGLAGLLSIGAFWLLWTAG